MTQELSKTSKQNMVINSQFHLSITLYHSMRQLCQLLKQQNVSVKQVEVVNISLS
jgi:hypothetical protein